MGQEVKEMIALNNKIKADGPKDGDFVLPQEYITDEIRNYAPTDEDTFIRLDSGKY